MNRFPPDWHRVAVALVTLLAAIASSSLGFAEVASPISAEESLAHFQLDPELEIQLVACEPEVIDPVAIRFGEDGRLWVVEMRDYPHGPAEGALPFSKIRVLTDCDGDGRYETSRVFAEELLFPTGIQPWQGGVIVTLAGEVIYLKDTDDDGRADLRETWYRGFVAENPQLRANHPRFGLDNRVTIANGLRGGTVENVRQPGGELVPISGRDFRFDPRDGTCEAISGNGQFGNTCDAFGRRFVCSNRQPLDHVVLDNRYLDRNPLAAIPAVLNAVVAAGEESRVYPLTRAWTTSNLHAGQFTAACGIELERGSALGEAYQGCSFTCEPTGSLVHRERLSPAGASFKAEPATPGREFLASPDAWFRPVNLEWGPDGGLYVVDMYRAVIEHPQFMPSELQERPDLRLGDDRGRIYRIVPRGFKPSPPQSIDTKSTADLVKLVGHEFAWQRETAARLIYERQDVAAMEPLDRVVRDSQSAAGRVAALALLEGLGQLSREVLSKAIRDPDARVREQAVVLAEPLLSRDDSLRAQIVALASDDDPRLRFQVALSLGNTEDEAVVAALAKIAVAESADIWTRRAVALAQPKLLAEILDAMLESESLAKASFDSPGTLAVQEIAAIVGSRREPAELASLVDLLCGEQVVNRTVRELTLLGIAEGVARRGESLFEVLAATSNAEASQSSLAKVFERCCEAAQSPAVPFDERELALRLLAHSRQVSASEACLWVLREDDSQPLKRQAALTLANHSDEQLANQMLAIYADQTPMIRAAIRESLAVRPDAARALLAAIESGEISRVELGAPLEARLRQHRDEGVRTAAARILKSEVPAERKAVLADYQPVLALIPDPVGGKQLFRQHCATCHHVGDVGVDVAPDISDSRVKTSAQLLTDILNPNQAIDNNYVSYTVVMADGNVHTGIVAAETASSVTLRQPENKTLTLLRSDIETIRSSGVSLMPEGFEKHLSHQQMADLIGFVKNWRYLDQAIPGTLGSSGAK